MSDTGGKATTLARRPLSEEAKETAGITSALLLGFLNQVGGPGAVADVLGRCGLADHESELRDENAWFSWETKIELFEAAAAVLDDPDFLEHMSRHALDLNVGAGLKVALRTLGSPEFVMRNIVRANARFNRSHGMALDTLESGHAVLRFFELGGGHRHHQLDCAYTAAMVATIPELFGLPRATVRQSACVGHGGEACVFDLRWEERPGHRLRYGLLGAASLAGLAASAVLVPVVLPVAGAVAAAVAGLAWNDHRRWERRRWRDLRRQVDNTEEVAQRLFASLQDLVSDLRLEEVVAKVTRNAQAAMAGRDFLLLVRDGGRLVCQSCSGLPPSAQQAVESWAANSPQAQAASQLIDAVEAVPSLAPLVGLADPLCSLASAPLTYGGEPLGLLVALAGQEMSFLPGELSVLESYAAQVAIAIGNARLYQNQRSLAARDPLTGLLNHRSFHEELDAALHSSSHEAFFSSLVLIDLDQFKLVNDEDGHAAGDRVLRAAARALADACRREDLAFRVGGDEFALLLPRLDEAGGRKVAERVCAAIAAIDRRMGASAGVAAAAPGATDKAALLALADSRLYEAKRSSGQPRAERELLTVAPISADRAIALLAAALELHDGATAEHSDDVAELALAVAARLGLGADETELVRRTALLHDVGKLAIPRDLLLKPGHLTQEEWMIVRRHPVDGAELLERDPALASIAPGVRASHERWDGAGYPDGLAGEEIPLVARVVAVCDAFEAMTGNRLYRTPRTRGEAVVELEACAGSQFDPAVVGALVDELLGVPTGALSR
jgi:diguanylate cyclase (GGDEF)-like protein/putative nucleotidyltransferase with HDIG domain